MNTVQLSKLWTVVGLAGLFFALNSWLATQGGAAVFEAKLITTGRVPIALTAIPICDVLLMVAAAIGVLHARRSSGPWHARVPIIGFEAIETASSEGRCYQAASLFVMTVLPLAALVHFWRIFGDANLVTTGPAAHALSGIWDWSGLTTLNDPARACTSHQANAIACLEGVTVLPGLQPAFYVVLTVGALGLVVLQWISIFRR